MDLLNIPDFWRLIIFICFCIVIAIQLFYYLYFFRRLAVYKPPVKPASQEYPVSIIVFSRDEAKNIDRHLPGILVQQYRTTHEVIVVNHQYTADKQYLLKEFKK